MLGGWLVLNIIGDMSLRWHICLFFLLGAKVVYCFPVKSDSVLILMGSRFEFIVLTDAEEQGKQIISKAIEEVSRLESEISSWRTDSYTFKINENAGLKAVKVPLEYFQLIRRCKKVSELTKGAFDISFAAMTRIYQFDGREHDWPDSSVVDASVGLINFRNIVLNEKDTSVFLKQAGMKIGFGAIGKGMAANIASKYLRHNGIENGIVDAGGDILAWGNDLDGKPWSVAIKDPDHPTGVAYLRANDMAVVTSGDYEKFMYHHGVRYGHIIDPRTGFPVTGLKSVTVLCPDAELADALATSVFVLGKESGLNLINSLKHIEAILITDDNEMITSKNVPVNFFTYE